MELSETKFVLEDVEKMLSTGLSRATFYKVDGDLREMTCTRDPSIIPGDMQPNAASKRPKSSTVVPVYDVDEDAWRSFLVENLISIERE